MNTIGKILVILNFLFAIVVGAMIVIYLARRTREHEAHEDTLRQLNVLNEALKTTRQVSAKVATDNRTKDLELDRQKQELKDGDDLRKAQKDEYEIKLQDQTNQTADKQVSLQQALGTVKRLTEENAHLNTTIKEREGAIVRIEADLKKLRSEAVTFEGMYRTEKTRTENLLARLQELERAVARERAGVANPDVMVIRNPNDPNPPAAQVNGKVEKVEGDLLQISLGTDHGVLKNNTLDVYRLSPEPKYLGMVRIVDANTHVSVARLIPVGNAQFRTPIRSGDLVTSKLTK